MSDWKKNVHKSRYVMDAILLLFFVIASAPKATGIMVHEWVSFIYLIPFVIHLLLHWDWIKTTPKKIFGKLNITARLNVIWDSLLYLMMIFVTFSGIMVSEAALPLFGIELGSDSYWFKMHHDMSNLLFPMLGIHLALHWSWIKNLTQKMLGKKKEA